MSYNTSPSQVRNSYSFANFKLVLPSHWHSSSGQLQVTSDSYVQPPSQVDSLQQSRTNHDRTMIQPIEQVQQTRNKWESSYYPQRYNLLLQSQVSEPDSPAYLSPNFYQQKNIDPPRRANKKLNHPYDEQIYQKQLAKQQIDIEEMGQYLAKERSYEQPDRIQFMEGFDSFRQVSENEIDKDNDKEQKILSYNQIRSLEEDEMDYKSYTNILKMTNNQITHPKKKAFDPRNVEQQQEQYDSKESNQKFRHIMNKKDSNFFSNPIDFGQFITNFDQDEPQEDKDQHSTRGSRSQTKPLYSVVKLQPISYQSKSPLRRVHQQTQTQSESVQNHPFENTTKKQRGSTIHNPSLTSTKHGSKYDNIQGNIQVDQRKERQQSLSYILNFEDPNLKKFRIPTKYSSASRNSSPEEQHICQRFVQHHHIYDINDKSLNESRNKEYMKTPVSRSSPSYSPITGQSSVVTSHRERDRLINRLGKRSPYQSPYGQRLRNTKQKLQQSPPIEQKKIGYQQLHGTRQHPKKSILSNFIRNLNR